MNGKLYYTFDTFQVTYKVKNLYILQSRCIDAQSSWEEEIRDKVTEEKVEPLKKRKEEKMKYWRQKIEQWEINI